jgi:hypothetical protein
VKSSSEEPRRHQPFAARKTSRWRETLRYGIVAGFEYAARTTAMREGHVWHPMLNVKTDAKLPSLDSSADITNCIAAVCCTAAKG